MVLKFWGTRGSIPVPGKNTIKYGGNTPCVEIRSRTNKLIILDCGSGLRELGNYMEDKGSPDEINILLSHYHWDHIQGFPFFKPLYNKTKKIIFYGMTSNGEDVKHLLSKQMTENYFPLSIDSLKAEMDFKQIESGKIYSINGFKIETFLVAHPSPTLTYKISNGEKNIVYMTDNEINLEALFKDNKDSDFHYHNRELIDFCSGCDYLIHDSMYEEASVYDKRGWGHSSNKSLARFSILAGIKNLVLFHYNPDYTDEKIDELVADTRKVLEENNSKITCIAAAEGLEISF
ncbi:MAG: MBL fold metallo-hydrolase [Ignavibacteriaceae bacterium]